MNGRVLVPLVVLSGAAVGVLAVMGPVPRPVPPGPTTSPVTAAEAVCPPLPRPLGRYGFVAVADLPNQGAGSVTVTSRVKVLLTMPPSKTMSWSDRTQPLVPLVAHASGSAAPGLGMLRSELVLSGSQRGYLLQQCLPPSPERWFLGGRTTQGDTTVLELVNPDPTSAQVDVDVFGPAGEIDAPGGHGIVLPPYAVRTLSLTALAPEVPLLAVRVTTSTGRVAASGFTFSQNGLTALGMSSLAPVEAGTSLLIPGVTAGNKKVALQLYVPGSAGANVSLRLLSEDGSFVPVGGDSISAPAGRTTTVDLTKGFADQSATVWVTSSVPLLASLRTQTGPNGTQLSQLSPAAGLDAPALLPGIRSGTPARVYLAAGATGGTVSVAMWPAGSAAPLPAQTITVPAQRQVIFAPATTKDVWYSLVVTPVSGGPVSADVVTWTSQATGTMIAAAPFVPLVQQIQLPAARFDVGVAQP